MERTGTSHFFRLCGLKSSGQRLPAGTGERRTASTRRRFRRPWQQDHWAPFEVSGRHLILKQMTRHGEWLLSPKEQNLSVHLAEQMMQLRRKYPEILQFAEFDSVPAVLNGWRTDR